MMHFRELSESVARSVDRTVLEMAHLRSLEALESHFINCALRIIPGDCLAWNNWEPDWSGMISGHLNADYHDHFMALIEAFTSTVHHHPVILANQFPASSERVLKLSDFEAPRKFLNNPIFREVYRHIDSQYQIAYTPCLLSDRRILLTVNRQAKDFGKRDMELLHYMGMRLALVAKGIDRNKSLEKAWSDLCERIGSRTTAESLASLTAGDLQLLTMIRQGRRVNEIAQEKGIRRDTLDKRLGSIRERLGLETHNHLLSTLAELKKVNQ
ncbi:MAG: hypothetical protein RLZZ245_2663 [Verrucomicrobiota bacterium]